MAVYFDVYNDSSPCILAHGNHIFWQVLNLSGLFFVHYHYAVCVLEWFLQPKWRGKKGNLHNGLCYLNPFTLCEISKTAWCRITTHLFLLSLASIHTSLQSCCIIDSSISIIVYHNSMQQTYCTSSSTYHNIIGEEIAIWVVQLTAKQIQWNMDGP